MANDKIPASITDGLVHVKDSDRTERVILPFTRYANVLNAPRVVTGANEVKGAPFALYITETEELSISEIRQLCGGII